MFNALKQLGPILVLAVLIRSYKLGGFKKKHLFLTVLKVEVRDQGAGMVRFSELPFWFTDNCLLTTSSQGREQRE